MYNTSIQVAPWGCQNGLYTQKSGSPYKLLSGQDKNIFSIFPHFPVISPIFPQIFFIFFLWLGNTPTRESPGYATTTAGVHIFLKASYRPTAGPTAVFSESRNINDDKHDKFGYFFFFIFLFFFLFLVLPGCSFKCYHLFSHEAQGRNVPNSLTVGMGFHCSYVPSST